jgi:hypothetical protein
VVPQYLHRDFAKDSADSSDDATVRLVSLPIWRVINHGRSLVVSHQKRAQARGMCAGPLRANNKCQYTSQRFELVELQYLFVFGS